MREVAEVEYRSWKCIMCGSRNKMLTVYSYYGEPDFARLMRCCNCGQETLYTNPDRVFDKRMLQVTLRKCLKRRACYNYNCPLHKDYKRIPWPSSSNLTNSCCTKNPIYEQLMVNCEDKRYK